MSIGALLEALPAPAQGSSRLLRETVYDVLKRAIVDGRLPPGERLRDGEIAARLQVSRMPVREAMRRLADEGLVVAEASRWTKVAPVDAGAAVRIYPIIWTLECLALRGVRHWGQDVVEAMRAANAAMEEALRRGDAAGAATADDAFHDAILAAAGNPELAAVVHDLKTRIRRIEVAYLSGSTTVETSVRQHADIVTAVMAGDLGAAADALRRNWSDTLDRVVAEQPESRRTSGGD